MRAISAVALFLAFRFPGSPEAPSSGADTLAQDFLASLGEQLRREANLPFSDSERTAWNYVPMARRGVSLAQLSPEQTRMATKLLRSSLSDAGYKKVEQIRMLEDVLFELEGRNPVRNKGNYIFVFFGEPRDKGIWAWRYEGHHVSLNFTYRNDILISSTPQFLGSNPAEVRDGSQRRRVLGREQDLAFDFLISLDHGQRSKAIVAKIAPPEILTANQRKVGILERTGIAYADLNPEQRKLMMNLLKVHAEVQTISEQKRRLTRVESNTLVFAWMGSVKPGSGHYYRIQGSKFVIEYDNTQNNANHIHTVWRDYDGDFGGDALAEHYATSTHHAGRHRH